MSNIDKEYYIQEVEELTDLVRSDDEWEDLRELLIKNNFDVNSLMLVSFFESEEEMEYGAFLTKDKNAFEYSRSTENDSGKITINKISDMEEAINKYPQFEVALTMI